VPVLEDDRKVALALRSLSKDYGTGPAVRDVTLEVRGGEFFSILGPSGCGKTTLLRMIAGFEEPSGGRVFINGRDCTRDLPQHRSTGMVFQNYALFPHMTVAENIAFGLEARRVPRAETDRRVRQALEAVGLREKHSVAVTQLSGGEQQRVAVARAIVVEPAVLLFDEPLSNLDGALRVKTRGEIHALQRRTGITTLYVTHDQSEAMSLSDRLAVMRAGRIEQVGTPAEVYERPVSPFVAEFLGGANLLQGRVEASSRTVSLASLQLPLPGSCAGIPDGEVIIAAKPETLRLAEAGMPESLPAVVEATEYLGFLTTVTLTTGGVRVKVSAPSNELHARLTPGDRVALVLDWSRCSIFPSPRE